MINLSINSNELQQLISSVVKEVLLIELQNIQSAPRQEPKESLLKTNEVADFLKVSPLTIKLWKRDGKIPYRKIGRLVFYDKTDVLNSVKSFQNVQM